MNLKLSNPRRKAVIENWPSGSKRVQCTFEVESNGKHGERVIRTTTGKPKALTYCNKACIVDGDDGRTYLLCLNGTSVRIADSDMQHDATIEGRKSAYIYADGEDLALFDELASLVYRAI